MKELERIRWRCRRGLLELDILLLCFVEQRYAVLDAGQRAAFAALLEMPDAQLWDMIAGREMPSEPTQCQLLEILKGQQ